MMGLTPLLHSVGLLDCQTGRHSQVYVENLVVADQSLSDSAQCI